jgi:hypothetical protein
VSVFSRIVEMFTMPTVHDMNGDEVDTAGGFTGQHWRTLAAIVIVVVSGGVVWWMLS